MKIIKQTLLLALLLLGANILNAQVTIGSLEAPVSGSLLDLRNVTNGTDGVTASKGLGLPRVSITNMSPTTNKELAESIGNKTDVYDLNKHIGLLVYNVNESFCKYADGYDTILAGLHVWDGTRWNFIGEDTKELVSTDVYELTDLRDGQIYLARQFGNAGDWMLQNMNYLDNTYTHYTKGEWANKAFIYPGEASNIPNNDNKPPATWIKEQGILYAYQGAVDACPAGWHIPSLDDWNKLEEEIYNNAHLYSHYTKAERDKWLPHNWDSAWNQTPSSNTGNRPITGYSQHVRAMTSNCSLIKGSSIHPATRPKGNSLSAKQGGFDIFYTGHTAVGTTHGWMSSAAFWTSDVQSQWNRLGRRYYGAVDEEEDAVLPSVLHLTSNGTALAARCKKD